MNSKSFGIQSNIRNLLIIMAKTEDIEAKLAAYVDGDIDPAGRAEIEKHLAGNPRHRELLTEFIPASADLLRALPRDMAPADVAETINSQLERAVLLGDVDNNDIAGSIGIFSQFRAIAAVLGFRRGGFGGRDLPSAAAFSNRHRTELADLRIQPSTTAPAMVELATQPPIEPRPLTSDAIADVTPGAVMALANPATAPTIAEACCHLQIAMADDPLAGGGLRSANGLQRHAAAAGDFQRRASEPRSAGQPQGRRGFAGSIRLRRPH